MSSHNPYDDYDAIDPWAEDEDDLGGFAFVEDEYDSTEDPYDDGFGVVPPEAGVSTSLPKTMLRPVLGEAVREEPPASQGGLLRRRTRKERRAKGQGGDANAPQPIMNPVPSPPQPVPVGRTRRERAPRRRRRHHFGCLFTLLLFVGAIVGAYWFVAHPIDEQLAFSPAEAETVRGTLAWSIPTTPSYILALGSDAREGDDFSRTDTMLLIRVDFWGDKITMLSIPRDTMVEIEGQGTQKINAAYAFGGAGGAVRAVRKLTGAPVNHVAVLHFEELAGLVDYLGGVTVNVPVDVYDPTYTGLVLDSGMQTMDGETALLWARTRYGYESGDFQRQENQRILMSAIMNRLLSLSPTMIPGALEQMGNLVGTDLRCYNLVPLFLRFKLSSPTIYSASVPSTTAYVDGISYVVADDEALAAMMRVINAGGDPAAVEYY